MENEVETIEKPKKKARVGKRVAAAGGKAGKVAKAGKSARAGKGGKVARAAKAGVDAKSGETAKLADKRAARRRRVAEANTIAVILETEVRKFLSAEAKNAGMDIAPFMQKLVENFVLEHAAPGDPLAKRLAAKRAVLDRVVEISREVDAAGGFDDHFILTVMKRAANDGVFQSNYDAAVDADSADERALARAKAPINQQMGRLIKRAAGAKSKRDESGKILRAQVQGEVITTYTLLERA